MRPATLLVLSLAVLIPGFARLEISLCGTHRDSAREEVHLHRHITAKRRTIALAANPADASSDIAEIAILADANGDVGYVTGSVSRVRRQGNRTRLTLPVT